MRKNWIEHYKSISGMKDYIFELAEKKDLEDIFTLYAERIRWMDAHGIRQWNVCRYLELYPLSYYREQYEHGNLYSLRYAGDDLPVGAVVLRKSDERWPDKTGVPAYYIHNLVTRPGIKGAGACILAEAERLAIEHGKRFVCLDCAVDNAALNEYYASKGYAEVGEFIEGSYCGMRREKVLPQSCPTDYFRAVF